jgi:hypothetical protein
MKIVLYVLDIRKYAFVVSYKFHTYEIAELYHPVIA